MLVAAALWGLATATVPAASDSADRSADRSPEPAHSTFIGGCEIDEKVVDELEKLAEHGGTPRPEVFGEEGPNTDCAEVRVSVHSPAGA